MRANLFELAARNGYALKLSADFVGLINMNTGDAIEAARKEDGRFVPTVPVPFEVELAGLVCQKLNREIRALEVDRDGVKTESKKSKSAATDHPHE